MSNETTGFDPQAVADVFGSEQTDQTVDLAPATDEKPAPEAPKSVTPTDEKPVSARIAAAKRAEAKAASQRQAALQQETALRTREEQIAAREKAAAEAEGIAKLLEEDPAKYFELKKLGPKGVQAFLEKLANGVKPEEAQERRLSAIEEENKRLKEAAEARERADQERIEQARRSEAAKAAETTFVTELQASLDKYPSLEQEFNTPESAIKAGYDVLHEVLGHDKQGRQITRVAAFIAQNGAPPTNEQIFQYLDEIASKRIEARKQNAWRTRSDESGGQPSGQVTRSPTVTGKTRTISARDTSSRATTPSDKWTQEWADEESLRILQRGSA
jgi:hypothetical protein